MGLDSECDVLVAGDDVAVRKMAATLRDELLAEQLGTTLETVAAAIADHFLVGAVEVLRDNGHSLRHYELPDLGIASE